MFYKKKNESQQTHRIQAPEIFFPNYVLLQIKTRFFVEIGVILCIFNINNNKALVRSRLKPDEFGYPAGYRS